MIFSWDDDKDTSNQAKHGVSFETAKKVFDDPLHLSTIDDRYDDEERWQTIGMVGNVILLLVAHSWKEGEEEDHVRIISARKATPLERERYENEIN